MSEGLFQLVIGIYGVSGSGKSHALSTLQSERPEWRCVEGSQMVDQVLRDRGYGGGLADMNELSREEVTEVRLEAIQRIRQLAGVTVVAGHGTFPVTTGGDSLSFNDVFTDGDATTYHAILYLDSDAATVARQSRFDETRQRPQYDITALEQWIDHDRALLQCKCAEANIHFAIVRPESLKDYIVDCILPQWLEKVQEKSETALRQAVAALPPADCYLLLDGDRTMSPDDTGRLFFSHLNSSAPVEDPLKSIFQRYEDYNFQAFLEVAMLYAQLSDNAAYQQVAKDVGQHKVKLYDAWLPFLSSLPIAVHPVLVSCSVREAWTAALASAGLSSASAQCLPTISIIAGNHVELHRYIVDGSAKGLVVTELRKCHPGCTILSFGDSVLDEQMLNASDRAYVVLDPKRRNRSLQPFLQAAKTTKAMQLSQVALEDSHWQFLHDGIRVGYLDVLSQELTSGSIYSVWEVASTSVTAVMLGAQTRRAFHSPPDLQAVHEQVGLRLADTLLDAFSHQDENLLTVQDFNHVQGGTFAGVVVSPVPATVILAMMRAGEPMARGVFGKFPQAHFVHYYESDSLDWMSRMNGVARVLVVDSVVNRGTTVRQVLHKLDALRLPIRSYVLSGVMQAAAALALPQEFPRVRFVALRVSENQYTGRGGTDTGNRLFGTVDL